jgi:4-hydroxybenzoate polyprenyltransferase
MSKTSIKNFIWNWLRLLRLPNLFTVPGDSLAGFLLAGGNSYQTLIFVMLTSFFIYLYGLVSNDIADLEVDREERPDRPLPSGAIKRSSAIIAAKIFMLSALMISVLTLPLTVTALTIILLISCTLYNYLLKKHEIAGPVTLGLCRAGNMALGILAVSNTVSLIPAIVLVIVGLYIFAVSRTAWHETENVKTLPGRFTLLGSMVIWIILLFLMPFFDVSFAGMVMAGLLSIPLIFSAWKCFRLFGNSPSPTEIQQSIGKLIRGLILFQAACCALANHPEIALLVALLIIPAGFCGKKFYSS